MTSRRERKGTKGAGKDARRPAAELERLTTAASLCLRTPAPLGPASPLAARFERALETSFLLFDPVVDTATGATVAYDTSLGHDEPTLATRAALDDAARALGREGDVGRVLRSSLAAYVEDAPSGVVFRVAVSDADLADPDLVSSAAPLSPFADKVILELSVAATLPTAVVESARELGYGFGITRLGSAPLPAALFERLRPELAVVDSALVHLVDRDPLARSVVRSLLALGEELGIATISPSVETLEERDALTALGARLQQGSLFARPGSPFPRVQLAVACADAQCAERAHLADRSR